MDEVDRLALIAIVGERGLLSSPEDMARYEQNARGGRGRAAAVVAPLTTNEVSRVVGYAVRRGLRLVVQGANTGLTAGGVPDESGTQLVLSLERLRDGLTVDPDNRSVTVAGGTRLSELNEALRPFGLTFPIDLGADPSIGGMIAANTGGARFLRYGDVRRNLLGIEVVLPDHDGTVLDLNCALWKNNAGLDLKQLFVGSSGSMGVVTRAVLAVQPIVSSRVAALIVPRNDAATLTALLALERGFGPLLTAFEGMSGKAITAALDHAPALRNPFPPPDVPPYAVLVEVSDPFNDEDQMLMQLSQSLEPLLGGDDPVLTDVLVGEPEPLWALRHTLTEGLRARGQVIACDIAMRRGDIPRFRAEMTAELKTRWTELEVCDFGHIGDGGLHFNMVVPVAAGRWTPAQLEAVKAAVFAAVVGRFDGSFSAEHGIGPTNAAYYRVHVPAQTRQLAARLQRVLNSGNLGRVNFADGGDNW